MRDAIYHLPGLIGPEARAEFFAEIAGARWKRARTAQQGARDKARTNDVISLSP